MDFVWAGTRNHGETQAGMPVPLVGNFLPVVVQAFLHFASWSSVSLHRVRVSGVFLRLLISLFLGSGTFPWRNEEFGG